MYQRIELAVESAVENIVSSLQLFSFDLKGQAPNGV
jgi:hypothetical protein